jgi:hypothetical protein
MTRICLPTTRSFNKAVFLCGHYEAQDVFVATDDVDLIRLEPRLGFHIKESWQRWLLYRDPFNRLMFANPGLCRVELTQNYDVFVAFCQRYRDLLYINAIDSWSKACKTSVCWIEELWAGSIPGYKNWLRALDQFEHICVGYYDSAVVLSKVIGRACYWLPAGVDALRFSPYPDLPSRVIDVYSVGRRWEGIHRTLLSLTARKEIFYVHDTLHGVSSVAPLDDGEHRDLYAQIAKRSRYFMVAPAKMVADIQGYPVGQSEIGYRYYEGAAAGAVLLGESPTDGPFRYLFDWTDAVVHVRSDGSDVEAVLLELASDADRVAEISRRNAIESLLRHDWVYRWMELLRIAGLQPTPQMIARKDRLMQLASEVMGVTAR